MNHQKIYDNIILNAKNCNRTREDKIYYENHHIIPKCLEGVDEEFNRVLLTSKEHFLCHKLLTYIYPQNRKIACAFHYMAFNGKHLVSLREYEYAIKLVKSIPVSEDTIKKHKESIPVLKGKTYEEVFGEERAKEIKIKKSNSGKNVVLTKERNKNVSSGLKSKPEICCPYCNKIMNNSNGAFTKYHGINCDLYN